MRFQRTASYAKKKYEPIFFLNDLGSVPVERMGLAKTSWTPAVAGWCKIALGTDVRIWEMHVAVLRTRTGSNGKSGLWSLAF